MTSGAGGGKTSVAIAVAWNLRRRKDALFHTVMVITSSLVHLSVCIGFMGMRGDTTIYLFITLCLWFS